KTSQFNLNGLRHTEAGWHTELEQPGAFTMAVSYQDKFGPLGKIAVLKGRQQDSALHISTWVMSCRAFSRRIEHRCLEILFKRFAVEEIRFQFAPTPKNGPLREVFALYLDGKPEREFSLSRARFAERVPP